MTKNSCSLFTTIFLRLPAPLIMVTITILSSRSALPDVPVYFPGIDKVFHFIVFAALAFSIGLWFSLKSHLHRPWRVFLICAAVASVFGAVDELHQYFVPYRDSDIWDWVADTLGGMAGAAAVLAASRIWVRIQESKMKKTGGV